ncbi:MAG: transcription termination factor NusA [Patescibacteria group bacterium]|jgi:N utilization substance protein A
MTDVSELGAAIKQICEEKGIPFASVIETIESALAVAYRKEFSKKGYDIRAEFNPNNGSSRLYEVLTVVADELFEEYEKEKELSQEERDEILAKEREEAKKKQDAGEEVEKKKRFNPKTDITLTEAKKKKKDAKEADELKTELKTPTGYGRMAAQTAKQVIIQKLREAERETLYNLYKDRSGEVVNGVVQRVEGRMVFIDLGQAVSMLPPQEQIPRETYYSGQRLKVLLLSVAKTNKGPEMLASRAHADLVKALFSEEVPEIGSGEIEVKGVAREAGSRTKISVKALEDNIDPIGSCVGQRGTRVQTIIAELGGEKIDIIEYQEDPVKYIISSLSPAKIISVKLNEKDKTAVAEVKEDQLSLAIGRGGQNVRLASRLTGWKIDVFKSADEPQPDEEAKEEGEEEKKEEKPVEEKPKEKKE